MLHIEHFYYVHFTDTNTYFYQRKIVSEELSCNGVFSHCCIVSKISENFHHWSHCVTVTMWTKVRPYQYQYQYKTLNTAKYVLPDPPLCVREEHDDIGDIGEMLAGLKTSAPSLPPSAPPAPPPLPITLSTHRPTSACGKKMTKFLMSELSCPRFSR